MRLEVRELDQKTFTIHVNLTDTVLQMKEKIKLKKSPKPCDLDDQKLIYSGSILADDVTVEELEFGKEDYITLICNPLKNEKVHQAGDTSNESSYTEASTDVDNESSIEKEQNETEVSEPSFNSSESESDELSRNEVIKTIPDFKNLCSIVRNDPLKVPKILSTHGPMVFEKILQNQDAFMDLLDKQNACSLMEELDIKDHGKEGNSERNKETIDKLVEKGYDRHLAEQAFQACGSNESSVVELLSALKN